MKKRKPKPKPLITTIIIVLIIIGIIIRISFPLDKEIIACTEDAKMCPDGVTYVARIAPDCEFAPCPSKECSVDSDCVVFGETGECNCGCYNKDFLPQNSGGACFCQAPTSCECLDNKCQGIFE